MNGEGKSVMRHPRWLAMAAVAFIPASLGARASSLAADMELGRHLAAECMTCHRSATATSTIPNIFGLEEGHVSTVMRAYRSKSLPNPVMQNIAGRLSDEDIAALALFFSKTKTP